MEDTNSNLFIEISDDISENENVNISHLFTSSETSKEENNKAKKKKKSIVTNKPEVLNTTTGLNIMDTNIDNNLPEFIDIDIDVEIPKQQNNNNDQNDQNNQNEQNNKTKQTHQIKVSSEIESDSGSATNTSETDYVKNKKINLKMTSLPIHITHSSQSIATSCSAMRTNKKNNNTESKPESPSSNSEKRGVTTIVESMLRQDTNINGWDNDANVTAKNWYKMFKQQSFVYQWILDRNRRIGTKLTYISIISSSLLGIFTGFKLWIANDAIFQTVSNILLMLLNFLVALITASSKNYTDDTRNEKIRMYIEEVDSFLGEISAQVLKSPVYRMNADEFFKLNNDKYTNLISSAPNLSINEINIGKQQYILYSKHCDQHI